MINPYFRTFIGLPLRVGSGFLEARNVLMGMLGEEKISWVPPENYHVTLRFIGSTDPFDVKRIGDALVSRITVPSRTTIRLAGPGSFGPQKKPRVIWVGFEETDFFSNLYLDVNQVLTQCGIEGEGHTFTAHLTLGRIRSMKDTQGYYHALSKMKDSFREDLKFDSVIFYRSEQGSGGPVYSVLKEIQFR